MKMIRATVRIKGQVQGVNFRYFTQRTACQHGITGWVRNLPNGDVEALFEGRQSAVQEVIDWCRNGPAAARVDELLIDWQDFRDEFSSFEVHR